VKIRLAIVAGARPNFMKVAPLLAALSEDADFETVLIHTGQHYDEAMSGQFLRDLQIREPDYHLQVGSGTHAQQTAEIMRRLEPVLIESRPAGAVVVGDVNSTVAGALVAAKLGVAVIHAEAGLRSFDRSMPEEINRLVTDSISDLLLVTEQSGVENLRSEGKPASKIVLVGNLMVDSLKRNLAEAMKSDIMERLGAKERFGLVTLHRPANVDRQQKLEEIVSALSMISKELPLYWPVHPRTRARLESGSVGIPSSIRLLEPLGYLDFLCMEANASVILTDSGGVQEESTVLGVRCLTLRDNTERPATVTCGTNCLAGTSQNSILDAWQNLSNSPQVSGVPPLWDGQAGLRCRVAIKDFFLNDGRLE